ncbi:MAG: hypothetical protein LBI35_00690 [Burkholderiales bacterium]|jgi:hypothetical protein|nr:hypothetical protein [Burkholderiales bacterium]
MSAIWKFLQPLLGPTLIVVGTLVATWSVYSEGKAAGRSSYADEIAACEMRRAEDHAKLIADREHLLAQRTAMLDEAQKQVEKLKHENSKSRSEIARLDSAFGAASVELASARLRDLNAASNGVDSAMPGDTGAWPVVERTAEECAPCPRAFVENCADDALKVFRLQEAYEKVRTGDFSVSPEKPTPQIAPQAF